MTEIIIIFSYLLGSIPFGLILAKFINVDIRKIGSGNIGATNVLRTGNKKLAFATLVLDGFKGIAAILIAQSFNLERHDIVYVALAAVIGHIFPIWLKFKGGKGVATSIATITYLAPVNGVIMCIAWVTTFLITRTSSLSAIIAFITLPITAYFLLTKIYFVSFTFLAIFVIIRHKENIKRLYSKSEGKF